MSIGAKTEEACQPFARLEGTRLWADPLAADAFFLLPQEGTSRYFAPHEVLGDRYT